LKSIKVYSPVIAEKLVVGKHLSDVAQLMERGDASAALLPISALQTYSLRGTRVIPIAQNLYSPIRMAAGLSQRSKHRQEAMQFLRFAVSPDGQAIFRQSGFSESKPRKR
jgi:ABC-type molybdate transport system substrate-binding protein